MDYSKLILLEQHIRVHGHDLKRNAKFAIIK